MRQLVIRTALRRTLAPALLAGFAALASLSTSGSAQAQSLNPFASFNVTNGSFNFNETKGKGPAATFTGTETVTFNYAFPDNMFSGATGTTYSGAKATLTAHQTGQGTAQGQFFDVPVAGTLAITSGTGKNLLTATFTGGVIKETSKTGSLAADTTNANTITYSSSVLNQKQLSSITAAAFSVSLTAITNTSITVDNPDHTLFSFKSSAAGSFSAAVVPEPASLAMVGLGLAGIPAMVLVKRRKLIASS